MTCIFLSQEWAALLSFKLFQNNALMNDLHCSSNKLTVVLHPPSCYQPHNENTD